MKNKLKFNIYIIFLATLFLSLSTTVFALEVPVNENIPILIDELPLKFDVPPLLKEGRTLVPFRAIAEGLHIDVSWDNATQTVQGKTATTNLLLQIGNHTAFLNGQALKLDVPPEICNGRTLIPLRFFSETLGYQVEWLGNERIIKISSPPGKMLVTGFYALGSSETSSWKNLFNKDFPEAEEGNTKLVKKVALGWYSLAENGNLLTRSNTGWQRPGGWEIVLETTRQYHVQTEMVVHMTDKGGSLHKLISDPAATATAINQISEEATLYQGVNLDLEGLGWQEQGETLNNTRQNFSRFVSLLYQKLQEKRVTLTLTLHAPNSAYLGYDYQSLSNNCDEIIIMAYDYGPKPEPINLVSGAVQEALKTVPPEKLLLGISIPSETTESLTQKIGIAKRYQLKGIALWRLGLVTTDMWELLGTKILPSSL